MNKPSVAVIIPTFRRPEKLGRAIESVLSQTYKSCIVIVVDDNNRDSEFREETLNFMQKYAENERVLYLMHEKNRGGSAARNTGIKSSNSDYIAFLDDDDEFLPTKIQKQIEKISKLSGEWAGVYTGFTYMKNDKPFKTYKNHLEGNLTYQILAMTVFFAAGSTAIIRRDVLEELDGFDTSFKRHQDLEMLLRFFRRYKIAVVPDPLVNVYMDDAVNRISCEKLEKLKNHYLDKFRDDIEKFPAKKQKRIFRCQYMNLIRTALQERDMKRTKIFLKRYSTYLTFKDYMALLKLFMIKVIFMKLLKQFKVSDKLVHN